MSNRQPRSVRYERVKKKIEWGQPINMRELSDYTGVSYSTIRKLKWLPLIPEINKMFYEHFMLAIERKNGLDMAILRYSHQK